MKTSGSFILLMTKNIYLWIWKFCHWKSTFNIHLLHWECQVLHSPNKPNHLTDQTQLNWLNREAMCCYWFCVHVISPTWIEWNLSLCIILIVNELVAGNRCDIWNLSSYNGIRTNHHLFLKWKFNQLAKLITI